MAHIISDQCTTCDACKTVCPKGAISEGETKYSIDSALCDDCANEAGGSACASVCPVAAIAKP